MHCYPPARLPAAPLTLPLHPSHPHPCPSAGAADGTVRVWDRRSTGSPAWAFTYHSHAVTGVEWSPHRKGVFASAGEDRCVAGGKARQGWRSALGSASHAPYVASARLPADRCCCHRAPLLKPPVPMLPPTLPRLLCVWDLEAKTPVEADGPAATKRPRSATPHQLMFQHAGHRSPVRNARCAAAAACVAASCCCRCFLCCCFLCCCSCMCRLFCCCGGGSSLPCRCFHALRFVGPPLPAPPPTPETSLCPSRPALLPTAG